MHTFGIGRGFCKNAKAVRGLLFRTLPRTSSVTAFSTSSCSRVSPDLRGIYPPITTPFNADESIAYDKLKENISRWNKTKVKGYLVQGSTGECCFLSKEERVEMIRKVKAFASPDKLIMAGSGCESTAHSIEMSQEMARAGADLVLVVTPNYFKAKMTGEALRRHFADVADASPVPVLLYNVPANTGVDLPWEVATELAKHTNIVGMKESNGDVGKIGRIVHETKKEAFQLLAGSAGFLLGSLHVGAVGAVSALANALPDEVCLLQELFERGEREEATALQLRLIVANNAVTKRFGVPGVKRAMEFYGYYGGPARRPLMALKSEDDALLREDFKCSGFL